VSSVGAKITNVKVTHSWTNGSGPDVFTASSIPDKENGNFEINVGSGGSDEWSVQWTDGYGQCWFRNNKQGDIFEEDFRSGKPVNVNLLNGQQGFSVEMPVSSSCTDNFVDKCK